MPALAGRNCKKHRAASNTQLNRNGKQSARWYGSQPRSNFTVARLSHRRRIRVYSGRTPSVRLIAIFHKLPAPGEPCSCKVEPKRIVSETVSGSSAIDQRPGFLKLLDRLERDDVLIVTRLDRLGRNSMDVGRMVAKLETMGVRVHCLALAVST